MIGTTISHYKILSRLGMGGMGEVYEAEDLNLKRRVAIKVLPPGMTDSVERLQRFQREAEAVAALNHPNICTIHDIGEHEGSPFLVMELLKGQTLKALITGAPLEPDRVVELAIQIIDALDSAHAEGIVHRDLKPANLFITDRGYAKILDFGLAKLTEGRAESSSGMPTAAVVDESLTSPGATVGTVAYMSPEQVRGQELDTRTDLFSFGVVLYEMSTGKQPFGGATTGVIFSEILNGGYIAPVRLNPVLPDEIERMIGKLLEKDRDIRYQTARDLLADLKRLRRDTGSGHSVVTGGQPVTPSTGHSTGQATSAPPSAPSPVLPPVQPTTEQPTAEQPIPLQPTTTQPTPVQPAPPPPPSGPMLAAPNQAPPSQVSSGQVSSGSVPTMDSTGSGQVSGQVVVVQKDSGKAPWWVAGIAVVGLILLAALWMLRPTRQAGDSPQTGAPVAAASGTAAETASATDTAASLRKMIVVIPFENLGAADDEYFATGMTEEITSRLASVSGLGVISRNSAAQYAGGGTPIKQIGEELGVDYVLQGTVRWAGGDGSSRVRITPQLIDVSDDTQVWSESYDRVVEDIFEVQSDIASQVIGQLDVALLGSEQQALEARPTENLEAYKTYLRGWEYWTHPDLSQRNFQVATQMFQRAVELDPGFALAHAYLSLGHSRVYWFGADSSPKRLVQARAAADRALQIDPNLGQGHMALGYVHYYGSRDYEKALAEFQQGEQLLPGDAEAVGAIGFIRRRQGNFEGATASFKRALELDPRAAGMADNVATALGRLRRHEEADRYYDRSLSILPDQIAAHVGKAMNLWAWKGDTEAARIIMERMPEHQSTAAVVAWYQFEIATREFESILARLEAAPFEFFDTSTIQVLPKPLNTGRVLKLMGRREEARAEFLEALPHMERYAREAPDDAFSHTGLARVLSGLDRHDEAIAEIEIAMELLPLEKDALYAPQIINWRAEIYADAGQPDAALDSIEELLSIPHFFTTTSLRLHPNWDSLRDHPRYKEILQKYQ